MELESPDHLLKPIRTPYAEEMNGEWNWGLRRRRLKFFCQPISSTYLILLTFAFGLMFLFPTSTGTGNCKWEASSQSLLCTKFQCCNGTTSSSSPPQSTGILQSIIKSMGAAVENVKGIEITKSYLPVLDLSHFSAFSSLTHLTVMGSHVASLTGTVPRSLKFLNLSSNDLQDFGSNVFTGSSLEELDFANNKLEHLPNSTFGLRLKKLSLIGNEIQCSWVTGMRFYEWALNYQGVIQDIDETFCFPNKESLAAFVDMKMTILSALKVRETGLAECKKTDCECGLFTTIMLGNDDSPFKKFPIVHSNKYGNVSLTLKADCSNRGLSELPDISPYTVILSVDNNSIRDLSRLNGDRSYDHLNSISINQNQIENLESIINTPFFDRVQAFEIRNNLISHMSETTITSIFARNNNSNRISNIAMGGNIIYCDCNTFTKLKPSLIAHESIIRDWKSIRCRSPNVTVHDLKLEDACHIEARESDWPWWIVVSIESLIIGVILAKLWKDRNEYRRTGELPLFSSCIPRLPCDFMLEKDSNHSHSSKV